MFRRKTRNSTAYTGVGHAAPNAQQPNNNAMAAALTIGQTLKLTQPAVYNRLGLLQKPPPRTNLGLLKRSPSLQHSFRATSTANTSRAGSNVSKQAAPVKPAAPVEYHVDDSFNDSLIEQMGHEADAHYSNELRVRDLKLLHQPPAPKMVKKYIPTPNGIKVIEVPEATMKQEIARLNSMRLNSIRLGLTAGRTGLLGRAPPRSLSLTSANHARRVPSQRLSSLVTSPKIDESAEFDDVQQQIEHERQLARDLEKKRKEYEQLKALRAENERKMRELAALEEESARLLPVLENGNSTLTQTVPGSLPVPDPLPDADSAVESEEDVPIAPVPFLVDEMDEKKLKVDGLDSHEQVKRLDDVQSSDYSLDVPSFTSPPPRGDFPSEAVQKFGEVDETVHATAGSDEYGIEEVPQDEFDTPNLAQQLRPVFDPVPAEIQGSSSPLFDPVPEIIGEQSDYAQLSEPLGEDNSALSPPENVASSIRSMSSADSKSKPIKSAMKNSKSFYASSAASQESPAHQAYLSLTTAENTRLNSKLSSTQLVDGNGRAVSPEPPRPAPPKSPNTQQKRMSQSLRKQPSAPVQGTLAGRSLRASSDASQTRAPGMSSRTFKVQPAPIAPHPALQPNYQSPSKLKAAELYAKANSRPNSVFHPQRKSSFSKDGEHGKPEETQPQRGPRTMRPQSYAPKSSTAASPSKPAAHQPQSGGFGGFKSRLADSDDEDSHAPSHSAAGNGFAGFRSRFNDSDDNLPSSSAPEAHLALVKDTQIHSLRDNKKDKKAAKEEKPKKKKFLKKLFGRS